MGKNILIDIPFNIDLSNYMLPRNYIHPKLEESFKKAQTKEWIERRMALFMQYAGNSLLHQTDQRFLCLLRYTPETKAYIEGALSKYPKLPDNIRFTTEAQAIIDASIRQKKELYRVIIDSDNMYMPDFISRLQRMQPLKTTQTLMCQEGYVYDEITGRLASIFHRSPSFYVAIYNLDTYRTLYEKRLFEKHWHAINYPYEIIGGKNYCVVVHEQNVDNEFNLFMNHYEGKLIEGEEKKRILDRLHIKMTLKNANSELNSKKKEIDKVSVIMPIYNRIAQAEKAIKSVVAQTYSNWELIIVNDGSTEKISGLEEWAKKDQRIKLINSQHEGVSAARNIGIEQATGMYIAFLDADDGFKVDKIEKQLKYMKEKRYDFCHTMYDRVDEKGKYLETMNAGKHEGRVFTQLIEGCAIATGTVMVKRAAIGNIRFAKGFTIAQDGCFWIDIAYRAELGYLREALSEITYTERSTACNIDKVMQGLRNIIQYISNKPEYQPYLTYLEHIKNLVKDYEKGEDMTGLITGIKKK